MAILASGLLLPLPPASAQHIQRSADEKGTIRIVNPGPAAKDKAAEAGRPGEVILFEPTPPNLDSATGVPRVSRRFTTPEMEARRKALMGDAYVPRRVPMGPPAGFE